MDERRLEEHDPNPLAGEPYPVLVLDERDGVSTPYRERDALVHWHEDLQLVVVSQGVMDVDTSLGHFDCGEGQAVLFNAGVPHRATGRMGSVCTSFLFPAALLGFSPGSEMHMRAVAPYVVRGARPAYYFDGSKPWHSEVVERLETAREAALRGDDGPVAHYRVLAELACAWALYIAHVEPEPASPADAVADGRMRAFVGFIEQHYGETVSLADIAAAAGVSKAECGRVFRSVLSTTPYAYLTEHRVRCAADMIREGTMSMTGIAHACGFGSASHFSKAFKEAMGVSPREYRNSVHG